MWNDDIDRIDEVRRQNLINHLKKCKNLSEVKKLAKMHHSKKDDFLRKLESEQTFCNKKKGQLPVTGHRVATGGFQEIPPGSLTSYNVVVNEPKITYEEPVSLTGTDGFNSGLCECCFNCKYCILATLFPPCFMCWLFTKSEEDWCTPILCPCAIGALRTKIRSKFKISGEIWLDFCLMYFCTCCSMIQISNEMNYQGVFN